MTATERIERAIRNATEWGRTTVLVIESLYDGAISCTTLRASDDVAAQVARIESATNKRGEQSARVTQVIAV